MTAKRTTRIAVACALGRRPEFVDWLTGKVEDDRYLSKRVDFRVPRDETELEKNLSDAEVYATYQFSERKFDWAPRLKWLHLGLAGVDSALFPRMRSSKVIVTSSRGLHDETVPQATWAFVLGFATGLHEGYCQKHTGLWDRKAIVLNRPLLSTRKMLVVGTGRIGQRIARLAKQAGMEVWGVRRSRSTARIPGFDRVLTQRSLHTGLAWADYVVLIVPGGASTERMIGAAELKRMKPSAYLINMARGSVVDEPALISSLRRGEIAGAGLDVFAEEPLPDDHPFYTLRNVAMTPHTSGDTADYSYRAAELFLKNLRRYLQGKPLFNQIDKRRGY
jgi:phosphoglycerate dehydrogenase-like enzyme